MLRLKKIIYGILIFFISLVLLIMVAANSSFVIKKAADIFAPDYNISYSDITGNIFTGVKIAGLKFSGKLLSKEIRFSWNPSKILYEHIAINEISGDHIDVNTIKALIDSFPKSEENNDTSSVFPFVVTVDKVHVNVDPFTEVGIGFQKTVLDAKDLSYQTDAIEVGDLMLSVDTNITKLNLHAALKRGTVNVKELTIMQIDSEALEHMLFTENEEKNESVSVDSNPEEKNDEALNPLIPKAVVLEHFNASLKPRVYDGVEISNMSLGISDLKANILDILENRDYALQIEHTALNFESSIGKVVLEAALQKGIATVKKARFSRIDTQALQQMFMTDSNETKEDVQTEKSMEDENNTTSREKSALIPQRVVVKSLQADILPATFDPLEIFTFTANAADVTLDVESLIVENGNIELNATTNLSNIYESGKIKKNHFDGKVVLTPNKPLFELYQLPIRKEAIGDIQLDLTASSERVEIALNAQAKHILMASNDQNKTDSNRSQDANESTAFNIDIESLKSYVTYEVASGKLAADTKLILSTPYAKDINITNRFNMDGNISYSGNVEAGRILGMDPELVAPANNLHIVYKGDLKQVETKIDSEGLKGFFHAKDLKKEGVFHLETKKALHIGKMVALPAELNATEVNAVIDVPLNFEKPVPIKGKAKITSNVANVDADLVYGDTVILKLLTTVTEDSLLKQMDEHIQWQAISPLHATMTMGQKQISAVVRAKKLTADMLMKPFDGTVKGKIHLAGLLTTLEGKKNGDILIKSDVGSFKTLLSTVNEFYKMQSLPKVDGKLALSLKVDKNSNASLTLTSPQVIYHADRKTDHMIDDVKVVLSKKKDNLELRSYQLTYNKMTFYATKPSFIAFKETGIEIPELWLNDQLKVAGGVDLKRMKGEITANAEKFHFSHELIDVDTKIDIKAVMDGNNTDVKGKVTILGGNIHYDLSAKTFPSDSDIIIVQEMKKEEPGSFMDHLTMLINVDTQEPLVYKQGPVDVKAKVELGIHKAVYSDPMIIGSIDLVDGGSYTFEGKKFVLERSHIYLTGDPSKPMLDLTVKYRSLRHLITINVTGTPAVPNILFSSVPSLTKEQILSIILFDSEDAAGSNNANDMMKMMGGAMAKSALNNLGVKIDHLVLGEGNSVEVGKKLTDNTTIIYINGEIPKMEMRYHYSPSIEVVVGASEQSESLDVVYRKDFNLKKDDDIVIKGRKR